MRIKRQTLLTLLPLALTWGSAKEFVNLGFDDGGYPIGPSPASLQPSAFVLPGWTARMGDHIQSQVLWNNDFADYGSVGVQSAGSLWGPLYQGRYGVRLAPGVEYPSSGPVVAASISQVGMIPNDSNSLLFRAGFKAPSELQVLIEGRPVPVVFLSGPEDSRTYGVDVRPFAGRDVELRFTGHPSPDGFGGGGFFDSLSFSPMTVPEPSTWVLLGTGGLVFLGSMRRRSGNPGAY